MKVQTKNDFALILCHEISFFYYFLDASNISVTVCACLHLSIFKSSTNRFNFIK